MELKVVWYRLTALESQQHTPTQKISEYPLLGGIGRVGVATAHTLLRGVYVLRLQGCMSTGR